MKYRYEVKRRKKSDEEIADLHERWGHELDEFNQPYFDINNPEHLFNEPEVLMLCEVCGQEYWIEHEILVEVNYGLKGVHNIVCVHCNKEDIAMYPKHLVDQNNNPITIEYLLKNFDK